MSINIDLSTFLNDNESMTIEDVQTLEKKVEVTLKKVEEKRKYKVFQSNAISRACYKCTPLERQLLFYATTQCKKQGTGGYYSNFSVKQFISFFGFITPAKAKQEIKAAVKRLCEKHNTITIIDDSDSYIATFWLNKAEISFKKDNIYFSFTNEIGKRLFNLKSHFTKIDFQIIAQLKSYYAIRLYEIALSYKGFQGKGLNTLNSWYFSLTIDDVQKFFDLSEKYRIFDITKRIIKPAIAEINAAAAGVMQAELCIIPAKYDRRRIGEYCIQCTEQETMYKIDTPQNLKVHPAAEMASLEKAIEVMKSKYINEYAKAVVENPKQPYESMIVYDTKILHLLQKQIAIQSA